MTVECSSIIETLIPPSPRLKEHYGREGQKNVRVGGMGEVLWNTVILIGRGCCTLKFWAAVIT